jgi:AraC-like DNA-binding protein
MEGQWPDENAFADFQVRSRALICRGTTSPPVIGLGDRYMPQALLNPPPLFQLAPPYDHLEAVPDLAALAPGELNQAAVLAVTLPAVPEPWNEVAPLVHQLRTTFPAAPVVLLAPRIGAGDDDTLPRPAELAHTGEPHVHGVLFAGEPPRPRLRQLLTDASALPEQIDAWLAIRRPELPGPVARLIHAILERSPRFSEIGDLLSSMGHAERTVRTWFRHAGVPGPGKWLAVSHAVRAALRLQAEERTPLLTLAVECGYSDHSSLSRQSLRLFGVRPGAIRRTLGWEWLVERWLGADGQTGRRAD